MTKQIELRCILNIELLLDWLFIKGKALGASIEAVPRISKGKLQSSASSSESTEYISEAILTCLQTLKWLICSQQEALLISKELLC